MNEEIPIPPSRDEARAALAQIEDARTQTRKSIAQSMAGPTLILWGAVWIGLFSYAQFRSGPNNYWWVFIAVGFIGSFVLPRWYPARVKQKNDFRVAAFWLAIMAFQSVLLYVVMPWNLLNHLSPHDDLMVGHRITAYFSIFPMLAYVLMGIWIGRFFVWLGLLVTALILLGFFFLPEYFYVWVGVTGGGALALSGVFIRKFWK